MYKFTGGNFKVIPTVEIYCLCAHGDGPTLLKDQSKGAEGKSPNPLSDAHTPLNWDNKPRPTLIVEGLQ